MIEFSVLLYVTKIFKICKIRIAHTCIPLKKNLPWGAQMQYFSVLKVSNRYTNVATHLGTEVKKNAYV